MLPLLFVVPVKRQFGKPIRCSRHYLRASATPSVYPTQVDQPWRCGCWGNLGLAYAGDAGTALTLTGADADRCLVGEQFYGVGLASVSGSTNRWLTACRNRRFGVSTSALGFEYNRGDSEWCYLHNYCWNSRFYSGMAAEFPRSCITLTGGDGG